MYLRYKHETYSPSTTMSIKHANTNTNWDTHLFVGGAESASMWRSQKPRVRVGVRRDARAQKTCSYSKDMFVFLYTNKTTQLTNGRQW